MASLYYKLDITDRTQIRTKGSKALRREGIVPGVLYYAGEANVNISVDKMVLLDMEDTAKILNVSKKEACHLLEQNHKTMAEELDFRKQAPKIAQLLLESAH